MDLTLYKNKNFGDLLCDIYKENNNYDDFWMTRKQIGQVLQYSDPQKAMDNLHSKHKARFDKFSVTLTLRGTDGKRYKTMVYSTKGMYEACRWSKQSKADEFMDWVYEVLEDIRNHGAYMTPETIERTLTDPDYIIKLATVLKQEKQARAQAEEDVRQKTIIIEKQKPLVDFAKAVQVSKTDISVKDLAGLLSNQVYEIGQNRLFEWLRKNKYLCVAYGNKNKPSQKSLNAKLMTYKESTINTEYGNTYIKFTPKITPKGQLYFINKFKKIKDKNKLEMS